MVFRLNGYQFLRHRSRQQQQGLRPADWLNFAHAAVIKPITLLLKSLFEKLLSSNFGLGKSLK